MKFLIAVATLLLDLVLSTASYGQNALLLNKDYFLKYGVVKILTTKTHPLSLFLSFDSCATEFRFKNGRIDKEIHYDIKDKDSMVNVFVYKQGHLIGCDVDQGGGQEQHFLKFNYAAGKMISSVQTGSIYDLNNAGQYVEKGGIEDYKRYFYDKSKRLTKISNYEEDGIRLSSSIYIIWNQGIPIGYYPAKDENSITIAPSDSIYYQKKTRELQKIGYQSFSKKYFSKDVLYNKVIADSYLHLSRKEIFVNGEPISGFLKKIKKENVREIILEVTDNYFVFFKLID